MKIHMIFGALCLSLVLLSVRAEEDAAVETEGSGEAVAVEEIVCHHTCDTCTGPSADECTTCKAGFKEETSGEGDEKKTKCVDINECVETAGICGLGTYCANTEGSYTCEAKKAEEAKKEEEKKEEADPEAEAKEGDDAVVEEKKEEL